jgi:hypothetical protein
MRTSRFALSTFALSLFFTAALAHAAAVTGTVTDKTTGKPAAGDAVTLIDTQAGMAEAAGTKTDAQGHYTLNLPGTSSYLIRATHQGAVYFIAAPQASGSGDISVYDVAAKVEGVSVEADVLEVESSNGQLSVDERFFVHNTSSPPTTQWSKKSFEIVLPEDAIVSEVMAERPGGLPTNMKLDPDGPKGHYAFNFPIQPDNGEKNTLFQVIYTLPYASGKYAFHSVLSLPADSFAVLMPLSMSLTGGAGANLSPMQGGDAGLQTYLMKNAAAGKQIDFTVSGTGSLPRESQGTSTTTQQSGTASQQTSGTPGGGLGVPINTPDPLTKYKWWILGALVLILAVAAAVLLRRPKGALASAVAPAGTAIPAPLAGTAASPAAMNASLMNTLKEELFALESEKVSGTISAEDYAEQKAALETVLRRALKRNL